MQFNPCGQPLDTLKVCRREEIENELGPLIIYLSSSKTYYRIYDLRLLFLLVVSYYVELLKMSFVQSEKKVNED